VSWKRWVPDESFGPRNRQALRDSPGGSVIGRNEGQARRSWCTAQRGCAVRFSKWKRSRDVSSGAERHGDDAASRRRASAPPPRNPLSRPVHPRGDRRVVLPDVAQYQRQRIVRVDRLREQAAPSPAKLSPPCGLK
jgi:hypothetical protein